MCPKSFTATNFGRSDYQDSTGRSVRAYLLTRDALSLLVMGMTGKAAIMWKLRYIEAFNDMESRLRDMAALGQARAQALSEAQRQDAARLIFALGPAKKRRLRSVVRYRKLTAAQARSFFAGERANAKKIGSTQYIWRSCKDGARCERCANNDGHVFSWDEEPPGGHAGAKARCRCYPEAIIPKSR